MRLSAVNEKRSGMRTPSAVVALGGCTHSSPRFTSQRGCLPACLPAPAGLIDLLRAFDRTGALAAPELEQMMVATCNEDVIG